MISNDLQTKPKTRRPRHAALLACLALFLIAGCGKRALYQAQKTSGKIVIDGKLEPVWFRASQTSQFVNMYDTGNMQNTRTRIMYDDRFIYIAFECDDNYIWSTKTERDDCIWEEEVVDVYIDATSNGKYYREYQTNALGARTDLVIPRPGDERNWRKCAEWNSGFASAVGLLGPLNSTTESPGKWVVEMAIPWSDFQGSGVDLPPKQGDKWRLQLFRIDRPRDEKLPVCSSWSPSRGEFHKPGNFGKIVWE